MKAKQDVNGRVAITLSPGGVDSVTFLSGHRTEALAFYLLISPEITRLEERVRELMARGGGNGTEQ